jgi:hypothetical protein
LFESFKVSHAGLFDDIAWKFRRGAVFIPGGSIEEFAEELFVERSLRAPGFPLVCWPESRGVWSEDFVDENQSVLKPAPFKFCIGDQDPSFFGEGVAASVYIEGSFFEFRSNIDT